MNYKYPDKIIDNIIEREEKQKRKVYQCCICKTKLDYKPIRLVKQVHDNKESYGRYNNVCSYDFCNSCYKTFNNWIIKHKE